MRRIFSVPQFLQTVICCRSFLDKLDLKEDCHGVPQVYYVFRDGNPNAQHICRNVLRRGRVEKQFRLLLLPSVHAPENFPQMLTLDLELEVLNLQKPRKYDELNQTFPRLMDTYGITKARQFRVLPQKCRVTSKGIHAYFLHGTYKLRPLCCELMLTYLYKLKAFGVATSREPYVSRCGIFDLTYFSTGWLVCVCAR